MVVSSVPILRWIGHGMVAGAVAALFAGCYALYLAGKRRERMYTLRVLAWGFAGMQCLPAGSAVAARLFDGIRKLF